MPPIINSAVKAYKCTGRSKPCPAYLCPFPHSYLTPKKLCRKIRHIFPKFSRLPITLHLFSLNVAPPHPYFTPKHYSPKIRHIFPKFSRLPITLHLFSPMLLLHIPISLQNISLAKSDTFSPNSLAWQPLPTFSHHHHCLISKKLCCTFRTHEKSIHLFWQ